MSVDQYKKEVGMMNLEKLIETREYKPTCDFPIPAKELLARFEKLYTGAVNDVMREFCLLNQALPWYPARIQDCRRSRVHSQERAKRNDPRRNGVQDANA